MDQASLHGLNSGFCNLREGQKKVQMVYVDVAEEKIEIHQLSHNQTDKKIFLTIPLMRSDSARVSRMVFKKQSLDLDITSVLFKYRPSVYGLSPQLTTDFNLAIYTGWRYDFFRIESKKDPLGKTYPKITNRGFDFGLFAGPGTTLISPFSTQNKRTDEYNGMIMQAGFAGFLELNLASFGLAVGFDYLMNADRKVWIYHNKPWVGLIVGIALN